MEDLLFQELQKKNPGIRFQYVSRTEGQESFKRYGRVIDECTAEFCTLVRENQVMPESGSCYVPEFRAIDDSEKGVEWRETLCGQLDEQWGLCWGYNSTMTALEWHTCNEFNIAVTPLVLILGKREDIESDGRYDANKCEFFYLAEGTMVETYADTLHYGPCMVSKDGFSLVVGLERGTNTDIDPALRKDGLLMAKNKWLIAHESEKALIESGAKGLVHGPNWTVTPV